MLLGVTFMVLALPVVLTYDKTANLRNRRMLLFHPHQRRNAPFVIRVPYSKVVPRNSLFSHSVAWRAKLPQVKTSEEDGQQQKQEQEPQNEPEITQFHSQDATGQVMFGFNAPDQMRIETRNADGTVHGTYSYMDPFGQVIKRQYWDTGSGFHVTSNTYPANGGPGVQNQPEVQYTPEVQAARDLHFQLYQQALASLLPQPGGSAPDSPPHENNSIETSSASSSTTAQPNLTQPTTLRDSKPLEEAHDRIQENVDSNIDNDRNENTVEPGAHNGSIIIENPEYLRISWITENKKFRLNLYNGTNNHNATNRVQIRHDLQDAYNITKISGHSRSPK